jgi:hypothetical protein
MICYIIILLLSKPIINFTPCHISQEKRFYFTFYPIVVIKHKHYHGSSVAHNSTKPVADVSQPAAHPQSRIQSNPLPTPLQLMTRQRRSAGADNTNREKQLKRGEKASMSTLPARKFNYHQDCLDTTSLLLPKRYHDVSYINSDILLPYVIYL